MKTLSILLTDFYKFCHQAQYDPSIKRLVSYGTPRGCRLPNKDYVINFGIQAFCKEYLIDHFRENFFNKLDNDVEKEVTEFLTNTLPGTDVEGTVNKLMELKRSGYLPISIRTIPEGCKVSLKCPNIEIVNTIDGFEWISGFIESLISSYIWKPMICATVGHWYRETSNKYFEMTADDWEAKARSSMSEFGFRGADTPEDGIHSGAAWLLSFDKTATCAAIPFVNEYYNTRFSGSVYPIDKYMDEYRKYMSNEGKKKSWYIKNNICTDELSLFMNENEDWHGTYTIDESGRYCSALPLGYNDFPSWFIPDEIWNEYKEFSLNGQLIIRTSKSNWELSPLFMGVVGKGLISTEHSVMCSSTSLNMMKGMSQKDAEKEVVRNLLTSIYPNSSFSMVSDSYDYWRLVTEILPELKDEVMNHNGTLFVRGDSGDPVKIVAGRIDITGLLSEVIVKSLMSGKSVASFSIVSELSKSIKMNIEGDFVEDYCYFKDGDKLYSLYYYEDDYSNEFDLGDKLTESEVKGTVERLWEIFGGTVNSKGYKVLDPHIRAIYGDSITQNRQDLIYRILKVKGFSVENVALGAGSFSFHAYQGSDGTLYPYTRDTFQFAQKATYGESVERAVGSSSDGSGGLQMYEKRTPIMIYKDPKTDSDNFKKSMKGCCAIYQDENNKSRYYLDHDNLTFEERESDPKNALVEVFKDGRMVHEDTFEEIRNRLNNNKF